MEASRAHTRILLIERILGDRGCVYCCSAVQSIRLLLWQCLLDCRVRVLGIQPREGAARMPGSALAQESAHRVELAARHRALDGRVRVVLSSEDGEQPFRFCRWHLPRWVHLDVYFNSL